MKTILIILDGAGEEKIAELNNKTPLEYAFTPTLNKIAKEGFHKKTVFYPPGREPDSLTCILSMLGVGHDLIPKNRAYLEAIAENIHIKDDEAVLRCNLISYKDNLLESFNGKGLSAHEMAESAKKIKTGNNLKFYHFGEYRNAIVVKKNIEITHLKDIPPHESLGKTMDCMLRPLEKISALNEFICNNTFNLKNSNYMFYPWGVSEPSNLPLFSDIHNKACSCVCHAGIVKGIAKAMGITLARLNNSTGDTDTDLAEKARSVLNEIKSTDTVIAHINGADEVSHRKDLKGKIEFIEKTDKEFIKEIYENTDKSTRIIIASDHQTSTITGKHEKGDVDIFSNYIIPEKGNINKWLRL